MATEKRWNCQTYFSQTIALPTGELGKMVRHLTDICLFTLSLGELLLKYTELSLCLKTLSRQQLLVTFKVEYKKTLLFLLIVHRN